MPDTNFASLAGVDDLDLAILALLDQDCRRSNREIAKQLGKSPVTIGRHIADMEARGLIKGWGAQIDYELLGFDIIAVIEITISKGKLIQVEREIAKHPNVFGVFDITGSYDALVFARFRTRRHLSQIIKEILRSEYVERTNTHVILNTIKSGSLLEPLLEYERRRTEDQTAHPTPGGDEEDVDVGFEF